MAFKKLLLMLLIIFLVYMAICIIIQINNVLINDNYYIGGMFDLNITKDI